MTRTVLTIARAPRLLTVQPPTSTEATVTGGIHTDSALPRAQTVTLIASVAGITHTSPIHDTTLNTSTLTGIVKESGLTVTVWCTAGRVHRAVSMVTAVTRAVGQVAASTCPAGVTATHTCGGVTGAMSRAVFIVPGTSLSLTQISPVTIEPTITGTIHTRSLAIAQFITAHPGITRIALTLPVSITVAHGGTEHTGELATISHVGVGTVQTPRISSFWRDVTLSRNTIAIRSPWTVRLVTGHSRPVQITGTLLCCHITSSVSHAVLGPPWTLGFLTFWTLVTLVVVTLTLAGTVTPPFVGALHSTADSGHTLQTTYTQALAVVGSVHTWSLAVVSDPVGTTFTLPSRCAISMVWTYK